MTTVSFLTDTRLSPTDRLVAQLLDRLGRARGEVCHATRTLAAQLGLAVRTVQASLRRLVALGLISRALDYHLRARRRLVLAWRSGGGLSAGSGAQSALDPALSFGPPLHPPMDVSGDKDLKKAAAGREAAPPPPPRFDRPEPDEERAEARGGPTDEAPRKATPEEVQGLRQAAAAAVPGDSTYPAWCVAQARSWGLSWVRAAIGRVQSRREAEGVRNARGLTVRVLRDFEAEGGPPTEVDPGAPRRIGEDLTHFDAQAWAREMGVL